MSAEVTTAGSAIWQTVFVSFGILLVLFEIVRGWRLGLLRQIVRIAAVIAAYATAYFGGQAVVPILRPFLQLPDLAISSLAGAVFAFLVYMIFSGTGAILFKRTAQQDSGFLRTIFGVTGALLGLFFGLFFVWLVLVGVRFVGALADAQVRAEAALPEREISIVPRQASRMHDARQTAEHPPVVALLARLKNSVELGPLGEAVKQTDVVPAGIYQIAGKLGEVVAKPESAQRFLSFPGAQALARHPKILALVNDPEIADMLAQGRFIDLLHNQRLIAAANDPTLAEAMKRFDLQRALDYALQRQ